MPPSAASSSATGRRRRRARVGRHHAFVPAGGERQAQRELRAARGDIRRAQRAAVHGGHARRDGQAEAGAPGPGGDERLENAVEYLGGDPVAGVGHRQQRLVRLAADGGHHGAGGRRGFVRIDQEIEGQLLETVVVGHDDDRLVRQIDVEPYALLGKGWLQDLDGLGDRTAQIDADVRSLARLRERSQTIEQPLDAPDLPGRDAAELVDELRVVLTPGQQLRERLDRHQGILDLVGDAGGEHLEVGEPLGFLPLQLELFQGRQIAEDGDGAHDGSRLVEDRRGGEDHRTDFRALRELYFRDLDHLALVQRGVQPLAERLRKGGREALTDVGGRSEEHTSELQSLAYLVC